MKLKNNYSQGWLAGWLCVCVRARAQFAYLESLRPDFNTSPSVTTLQACIKIVITKKAFLKLFGRVSPFHSECSSVLVLRF